VKTSAEKAATEKAEQARAVADKAAADRANAERIAAEKAVAARAAADKLAGLKAATEKLAADKAAAEKAVAERAAQAKAAAAEAKAAAQASAPPPRAAVTVEKMDQADMDAQLYAEKKDAILRIGRPTGKACDLTDPGIIEAYMRMRNNNDTLSWFILGYAPNSQTKLNVIALGDTGFNEMKAEVPEDGVYMYLNHRFGDTKRSKFIFMTYVPDSLPGLKKSRVVGHRPAVEKFLKYITFQWHILDKAEMILDYVDKRCRIIGGADYSVQEQNKGDFGSYKQTTREFYQGTDKATQVSGVVYQKGPLTTTPMDLAGRAMVAAQSEFRGNLKDLNTK